MKAKQILKSNSGMTLIEIMIVLAIVVGLMTTVGTNVINQFQTSKVRSAKIQINEIGNAIEMYSLDCGSYPTSDQGLSALTSAPSGCSNWGPNPYIKKKSLLKDPWNNDFLYERISGSEFEIISLGADGQEGGEGLDADVSNLEEEEEEE